MRWSGVVVLLSAVLSIGCSTLLSSVVDNAANRTGQHVGNAVGDQVGKSLVATYSPMMMQYYTSYLFALAFHAGGYEIGERPYKPGDYTRWRIEGAAADGEPQPLIERAYLFSDKEGNQWWKVKYTDTENSQTTIMEAQFAPDRSKLLRLRARFPNDAEAKEMPVEENTYYVPPRALTAQSLKGADKGSASVAVPAGTFKARRIVFGDAAGSSHEWFLVKSVPGGTVKYVHAAPKSADAHEDENDKMDASNYVLVLAAYGKDAKSELDSK